MSYELFGLFVTESPIGLVISPYWYDIIRKTDNMQVVKIKVYFIPLL